MFKISDPNVDIPDDQMKEVIKIVLNGGNGTDIYKAGIKTTNGTSISERQARRYRAAAEEVISSLDQNMLDNYLKSNRYMPDLILEETDTDYPPVIVPPTMNRTAIMDIETNAPSFGTMGRFSHFLICVSFLPFDTGIPYTLSLNFEDRRDDRRLLHEVLNEMAKYTFIIGHNVKGYDINWLQTRAIFYGWETPKRLFYYDTLSAARRIPLMSRKSLGHLMDFFRIDSAEKTQVFPLKWDRISSNKRRDFDEALSEICYHCEQDILGNREVYDILMQYDPRPSWNLWPKTV
jgi:hypothetical protein